MGGIAFGAQPPAIIAPNCPYAWIEMPVLDAEALVEVWTSDQPVAHEATAEITATRNAGLLFGCLQIDASASLDAASDSAYCAIFDFVDRLGYGHLLRVWNYFPAINGESAGLERYRSFCVGRHRAFEAKGRVVETDAPAACALGTQGGPLTIYFLAATRPGRRIENPRQVSAYRYPPQYGPTSPSFARAMLMPAAAQRGLFLSGTASIVGHATLHAGNAIAQAQETAANIGALLERAREAEVDVHAGRGQLLLKAYVRDAVSLPTVRAVLARSFGAGASVHYLQADVCRADLLVEVEGVYLETGRAVSANAAHSGAPA